MQLCSEEDTDMRMTAEHGVQSYEIGTVPQHLQTCACLCLLLKKVMHF